MEYIDALKDVKNNLINLINENNYNNSNLNNKFEKYDLNIQSEYANLTDLVENIKHDFFNMCASFISTGIFYTNKDNLEHFYNLCLLLSIISMAYYAKDANKYRKISHKCDDLEHDMSMCKLESKILKTKNEILDIELNKLDLAIEFLNSLTEEEKTKYLKLD